MKITVIGCGRWGSLIAWYLDRKGHAVSLYGRSGSKNMERFIRERKNDLLTLPESITLSTDLEIVKNSETIVISVGAQSFRDVISSLNSLDIKNKIIVLCMKGIEVGTNKRLSEIAREGLDPSCRVAVWLGPGHVEEFYAGIPNLMVIDSEDEELKKYLVSEFSSDLIRFYIGTDLIGNEVGAAAKNVIGIAAGILDGLDCTSLKGGLMARGTREIARLIEAMGGNPISAYGLCHLGDYQATVFSEYSHNRSFGEAFVRGEKFDKLAEGYYTVCAIVDLGKKYNVDLPICEQVYNILYNSLPPHDAFDRLFMRSIKPEF